MFFFDFLMKIKDLIHILLHKILIGSNEKSVNLLEVRLSEISVF